MQSANDQETLARRLAGWIVELKYEDLPDIVVQRAKQCILDQLGVQVRGATLAQVQSVGRLVASMGGAPEASVIQKGFKTSVAYAAYVNGTFGHSCEFDDAHFNCGHPGVCVIPAALAVAEREGASGKDLIMAVVAGYQAQTLGVGPIHHSTLQSGWHGTKVGGVFGAAAAAAKLLRLDVEQTAHALSVAASEASGTMEYDQSGGEVKRLHAGSASRSGVQAALLAQLGMTGPSTIFEGKRGIFKLFGDGRAPEIERFWQGRFHILDTMFKLYPAVGTVHAALNALSEIMREREFAPSDVESIRVGLAAWAIPHGAAIVRPTDSISAQFSLAFSLALRIVKRRNDLDLYLDSQHWTDPEVLAVADKVSPYAMTFEPGASELGATVVVQLHSGVTLQHYVRAPRGFPDNPASDADLTDKFTRLVSGLISDAAVERVMATLAQLEGEARASSLLEALAV
ncbi:MAG: MmgE/PrpD family protein [Pseudomonas sp.]|uniref:MmgE/PrpD family protein n=1 Tax=Pseudomonas sp. TaxID=306 RepID=UPI003981E7F4